ncbi:PHP domain-containing protein [Arenibacter sp. BSSL-BM3]|uniref:PHP domain-containing protein n=1 Tax=Arenibacter arenosicollis TaxID=2762274 RepID=A0ABR7QR99_9FLAO|nr:PHP domain-containing protein [Arenibacter arenosicollis]MBC8769702.1 PHP domain-containing protein [Arenibacter arenosicollis]
MLKKSFVAIPLIIIAILALFFHLDIHVIDALTLDSLTSYGIHIQTWRILFEPVLGLLLYFNRSIYPLQELPITLLWIMVFYISLSLIKVFKVPAGALRRQKVLRFLGNLPLLIGIYFSVFVVILFLPLPNNTIVNNTSDEILVTTHAHTEFSHDGLISQDKMWEWHKRNGFDAFFITDHANHKKTLDFSSRQKDGQFPLDPLIMVGQEHSGSNHMSLLGLNCKFETKGKSDSLIVDLVHNYGGAVIINHWFDGKGNDKEFYKDLGADGFEIENVGKELYYDRTKFKDLKKFCEENKLLMIGGLDFHGYGRACGIWNAFQIPNWHQMNPDEKEKSILEIIRNRDQSRVKVLMYQDRPFYSEDNLLFQPFITLVNYFRTLNFYQVLSWAIWLVLFQLLWNFRREHFIPMHKRMALTGLVSALFLVALGLYYMVRGNAVKGYSKVFAEYSSLLLTIGTVFMVYSLLTIYFRFFRKLKINT